MTEPVALAHTALAELSALRHGFFTRAGGVSEGIFASLNCGPGSGDDPARVAANRARALGALDLDGATLLTAVRAWRSACSAPIARRCSSPIPRRG
jgi:hypothetical protein